MPPLRVSGPDSFCVGEMRLVHSLARRGRQLDNELSAGLWTISFSSAAVAAKGHFSCPLAVRKWSLSIRAFRARLLIGIGGVASLT